MGDIEYLLSLPSGMAAHFRRAEPCRGEHAFVSSDPPDTQLGSAGGTAHILREAWQAQTTGGAGEEDLGFPAWLHRSRKLIVHGSGESRRLPSYAASGKPMVPIPLLRACSGQRPDQCLMDLQFRAYERLFWYAPPSFRVMVTSGDVLLSYEDWLPPYPDADVLIVGLSASPEEAQRHGVMVCGSDTSTDLAVFLQKPSPERLRELPQTSVYYLDTGIWLFNEKALGDLFRKCGWAIDDGTPGGGLQPYDVYSDFGPALGTEPAKEDPCLRGLRCAVLPLPNARFHHFGTNRSVLASVAQLQQPAAEQRSFGHASMEQHSPPVVQHSDVACSLGPDNRHVWIENSCIASGWKLSQRHVLTGIPPNNWTLDLETGVCLDCLPLQGDGLCIRLYGFDDTFRGPVGNDTTTWLDRPAPAWFDARGIALEDAGIRPETDIHDAPLFPVLQPGGIDPRFLTWLFSRRPGRSEEYRNRWLSLPRRSAQQLLRQADVVRLSTQRAAYMALQRRVLDRDRWLESCARVDLAVAARIHACESWSAPPEAPVADAGGSLALVHERMFRAALSRHTGQAGSDEFEAQAFDLLRRLVVGEMEVEPVGPSRNVLDDQIVWGRSPVRLDLAGGWTDTPPYCLEHGGQVVNAAVDLNGQPPIQVFGRPTETPHLVVRSIDLGVEDRITTYEELGRPERLGSGFGIARAALALAGLSPRFHAGRAYASLADHLEQEFGGGVELTMLAAVPKGSGLGTSSILAATLLGVLGEMFGLHWTTRDLLIRTLALEQILTSGGGWQDQAGGLTAGVKLIETGRGLLQNPTFRWLPRYFFSPEFCNTQILLYYTGLTRVAHDILGEIVRGIFLNSGALLNVIREIGSNALFAADVIQRNDWEGLCEAVRRSWILNQRIDGGTNPPAVQAILDRIDDYLAANKLVGAGGGGYMLMLAKDPDAARRIKQTLETNPPNPRARFVDLSLSERGFQVTRS